MTAPSHFPRPLAVRVVQWGVMLLALWNLGRALALWHQADWLAELPLKPDPRVRLVLALAISAVMALLAIGLRRRLSWSRSIIPILLAAYGVYELGMTIAFTNQPAAMLLVLAYIAFVGFAAWALWRPSVRLYFDSKQKEGAEPDTL